MKVLLTTEELREALAGLPITDVGGEPCVDGEALRALVDELVPIRRTGYTLQEQAAMSAHVRMHEDLVSAAPAPKSDVVSREHLSAVPETVEDTTAQLDLHRATQGMQDPMAAPTIEVAQALLNVAPRGACVGCKHLDHYDGRCPECDCVEYVDSVVRDPMQYAGDKMATGAQPPPWWPTAPEIQSMINVDLEQNPFRHQPGHQGGGAHFAQGEDINPNPPTFELPHVE